MASEIRVNTINSRTGLGTITVSETGQDFAGISTFGGEVTIPTWLVHAGDTNTKFGFEGPDTITAETAGSERLRIDSSGRLLLGTTTEGAGTYAETFTIAGTTHCGMTIRSATNGVGSIYFSDGTSGNSEYRGYIEYNHTSDFFNLATAATERLRIDSSGRLLVGHTASLSEGTGFQIVNTSDNTAEFFAYVASTSGARLTLTKSRSGTKGTNTVVQSGDKLGELHFRGADGSNYIRGATISAEVDGTPGTNDMPGRLVFSTTSDGASSQSERLRITSAGYLGINETSPDTWLHIKGGASNNVLKLESTDGTCSMEFYDNATTNGNQAIVGCVGNNLYVETGGSERLRVTSAGNVQINNDSGKLQLGASQDLQIYHDGSHSYIQDSNSASDLFINSNKDLTLKIGDGSGGYHTAIYADNNGSVRLYHDDVQKFRTTSTGVQISGTKTEIDTGGTEDCFRIGTAAGCDTGLRIGSTGTNTDTHAVLKYDKDENWVSLVISGESHGVNGLMIQDGGNVRTADLIPHASDTWDLGKSNMLWDDVYATNGTIQTSDRNEKESITATDLGLSFINKLNPVSFKRKGKTRTHYGLVAQDIETVITDLGKNTTQFAPLIKEDVSDKKDGSDIRYGLRYTELISPLIKAVQELSAEVETLKTKVATLESA